MTSGSEAVLKQASRRRRAAGEGQIIPGALALKEVRGDAGMLSRILQRPDLMLLAADIEWLLDERLGVAFEIGEGRRIRLSPYSLRSEPEGVLLVRHALELRWLLDAMPDEPARAGLAAARSAARFAALEGYEGDHAALGEATPPSPAALAEAWRHLAAHQPRAEPTLAPAACQALRDGWSLLGPVERLMETGGDIRLRVDARTGLNAYGCSHRPRPWAITFASSTASSVSERGFLGAEAARRRVTLAALAGNARSGLAAAAAEIRREIAGFYGLSPGAAVILAASGTDCELFALAVAHLHPGGRPLTTLLIAPEETGSGVPLAATGRHFAVDTARGVAVDKGALIRGFSAETRLVSLPLRRADGSIRGAGEIDQDCERLVDEAVSAGRRVVLHLLDVSKTGLLGPSVQRTQAIARRHGDAVDIVVDACQARLDPASLRRYIEAGWMVLVTGSKFFTGPPFAGAVLLPPAIAARLDQGVLPEGLRDYSGRQEWPGTARAVAPLADDANYGLVLRWQAALAEMQAFAAVPAARRDAILERFGASVRRMIEANPDLVMIPVPPLDRAPLPPQWDCLRTILSFGIVGPGPNGGAGDVLSPDEARRIYRWLNADLVAALPGGLSAAERRLAAARCHIGQPAPVATASGSVIGALRISAGARLVSGEPSHAGLGEERRLAAEIDSVRAVLAKISLILRHIDRLRAVDPEPTFR